jgi:hypothetical protein
MIQKDEETHISRSAGSIELKFNLNLNPDSVQVNSSEATTPAEKAF